MDESQCRHRSQTNQLTDKSRSCDNLRARYSLKLHSFTMLANGSAENQSRCGPALLKVTFRNEPAQGHDANQS